MIKVIIVLVTLVSSSLGRPVSPLSAANNYFGLHLLKHLSDDKNVFFSPFSISNAFGMLYTGSRGVTAQEISQVLGYTHLSLSDLQIKDQFRSVFNELQDLKSKSYELDVANRLVVQKDIIISEDFEEDVMTYFKSRVKSVDFGNEPIKIMNDINQWVKRQTRFKIDQILNQPLHPLTRLVIINAVYFKGQFETKFDKNMTEEGVFSTADGRESSAQMMFRVGEFNYTEVPELDSKLLEIPYSGHDISLYILLPKKRQGIKNLKNNLKDLSIIENAINNLEEVELPATIPKFKIETSYGLNSILPDMGMKELFSDRANLSGISGQSGLRVSNAIHKAYVEVNEDGTEAAAVSDAVIAPVSANIFEKSLNFKADHPFMFFIRDNKNGMILFMGHINHI